MVGVDCFVLMVEDVVVFEDVFVYFGVVCFDLGLCVVDGVGYEFGFDWYVVWEVGVCEDGFGGV